MQAVAPNLIHRYSIPPRKMDVCSVQSAWKTEEDEEEVGVRQAGVMRRP